MLLDPLPEGFAGFLPPSFGVLPPSEPNRPRLPLQWSAQLETQAKAYARTLAQRGELASSGALERPNQGENLFACPATTMLPASPQRTTAPPPRP